MTLLDSLSQRALYLIQEARKSPFFTNVSWNILGNMSAKVIGPIFSILVARILMPEDYGVFGVAIASMAFLNLTKDLGIKQAIIVAQEEEDWRSIQFTVQLIWGSILYLVLFFLSPLIANYFQMPLLVNILRLLGLGLFIAAIEDPLFTHYLRNQNYRLLFFRQIIPSISFGITALSLAFLGAGVYALVAGTLVSNLTTAIFLLMTTKWKPKIYLPLDQFLNLFQLGKHLIFQQFCGFLVLQADSLVVGKNLGAANVGFYRMGHNLTQLVPNSLTPPIQQVFFTDFSRRKNDFEYLERRYYQFVYSLGGCTLLFSIALYLLAPIIVPFILGVKWNSIVPVIQVLSTVIPFVPLVLLNTDISKIYNFNYIYSYFSSIRSFITIVSVSIASFYSLKTVILCWALIGAFSTTTNSFIFFKYQNMIKLKKALILLFILCWTYIIIIFYNHLR